MSKKSSDIVMSEKEQIVFGQTCESMKLVHDFLEDNGIRNVNWKDDEFDEATALALLVIQNQMNVYDFIQGGGFNSESSRYEKGKKVAIRAGSPYYASPYSDIPSGYVILPTSGVLQDNLDPLTATDNQIINTLKLVLLPSLLENSYESASYSDNKLFMNNSNNGSSIYKKDQGGYQSYSVVYMRKEDVCPSMSDIMISKNISKIMKVGKSISKGIELINNVTDIDETSSYSSVYNKQFMSDDTKLLNDYLNTTSSDRMFLFEKENETLKRRKEYLAEHNRNIKNMAFNNNGMFIKNLITDTIIYIPFRPDSVDESYTVNWEEASTRGSTHQVFGYESTTGSVPSMTFEFDVGALISYMAKNYNRSDDYIYSDETNEITYRDSLNSKIDQKQILERGDGSNIVFYSSDSDFSSKVFDVVNDYLNALKALSYPKYTNGIPTPPSIYISIANNLRFVAVCSAVNISHKGPMYIKNYDKDNFRNETKLAGQQIYMNYSVTINFNKVSNQDFSADTVEIYGDNWTGGQSALDSGNNGQTY